MTRRRGHTVHKPRDAPAQWLCRRQRGDSRSQRISAPMPSGSVLLSASAGCESSLTSYAGWYATRSLVTGLVVFLGLFALVASSRPPSCFRLPSPCRRSAASFKSPRSGSRIAMEWDASCRSQQGRTQDRAGVRGGCVALTVLLFCWLLFVSFDFGRACLLACN